MNANSETLKLGGEFEHLPMARAIVARGHTNSRNHRKQDSHTLQLKLEHRGAHSVFHASISTSQ